MKLNRVKYLSILLTLIGLCKPGPSWGQTFFTAGPEALGRAGRAAVNGVDSHYMNPAAMAYTVNYNLGVVYQSAQPQLSNPTNSYAIVMTDNSPDKYAAGSLGYLYRRSSYPDHTSIDQDFSLNVATKIVPTISIGFQARRLIHQDDKSEGWTKHNASFGALVIPAPFLGFAFVAYDFLNDDDLVMVPILSLGSHLVIMDIIRLRADISRQEKKNPNKEGVLSLGMELNGQSGFLFRTGGTWDGLNRETIWTAGMSWEGPRLSVAYGYRKNISVNDDSSHTLQAWINF